MQAREQSQGADYGNDDSDDAVAGAGLERDVLHTDLLADHSVIHEVNGMGFVEPRRVVFGQRQLVTGE